MLSAPLILKHSRCPKSAVVVADVVAVLVGVNVFVVVALLVTVVVAVDDAVVVAVVLVVGDVVVVSVVVGVVTWHSSHIGLSFAM